MNNFTYARPTTVAEAIEARSQRAGAIYIAGGTNLIDLMKENVTRPAHLIDINQLPLTSIETLPNGGLRLGALAPNADTAWHPEVKKRYPILSQAMLSAASAQLRNMATNGGNLLQRTRCYYFYDVATPCNKRQPGSGCSAINGFNRIHAILGTSDQCIATHPSDMCVALACLDATICVQGMSGERRIPMADFHRLPGDRPEYDNVLQPEELITAIELPARGFAKHYCYLKIRDRASYAFALVSVAAALELKDNTIQAARLALGGIAHKPWRDKEAEALMVGKPPVEETFLAAARKITASARGYGDNDFKIELTRRGIVRAFTQALKAPASVSDVYQTPVL